MFSDVNGRTAILPAQGKTLQTAEQQQKSCRPYTRCFKRRQDTDRGRCEAHQCDGDQKGIFASDLVAKISEQDRPEWPHAEPGAENSERGQCCGSRIIRRKEQLADQGGKNAVNEEIIPFEHRPQG